MIGKLKISIPIFLTFFLLIIPVFATVNAEETTTESGNRYIGETEVTIDEDVNGDLFVIGETVEINGNVEDTAYIAAGEVLINGDIGNDLMIAAQYVVINGDVNGDLRVVGGKVYINSSTITGDANLYGNRIYISENTTISGEENIDAERVSRDRDDNPTNLDDSEYDGFSFNGDWEWLAGGLAVASLIFTVISTIATIIVGYFVLRTFPVFSDTTITTMKEKPAQSVGVGCLVLIAGFFGTFILLFSIIGYKLWLLLLLLGIVAWMLAEIYSKYLVGRIILKRLGKENTGRLLPLVVGVLLVTVLSIVIGLIPGIGSLVVGLVNFIFGLWGIGAIVWYKWNVNKK